MRRALARLLHNERFRDAVFYPLSAAAFLWRRLMFRTTFIAVTGSTGKTTATACLATILSTHGETNWIPGGRNSRFVVARTVLRTRFRHRFTVIEAGTRMPGTMRRIAWIVGPDVVLVLCVLRVHSNVFADVEETAAEKAQLLSRLGKRGAAILNGDDPLVAAMANSCTGPVRVFGQTAGCDVRASELSSKWPARFSFRLHAGGESIRVQTKLVGVQFLNSALGAAAAALYCGVPQAKVAAALEEVEPVAARMKPMYLPNGAIVLRDDYHATLPTFESALAVLRDAGASRRIVIAADIQDSGLSSRARSHLAGELAAAAADMVVFVGERAGVAKKSAIGAGLNPEAAFSFKTVRETADFLQSELRAGDLAIVKDWSGRHLERAILAQVGSLSCWRTRCQRMDSCDTCPELKLVPIAPAPPT